MSNNTVTFCYVSETGKEGDFIQIPCSPPYGNKKINALGQPSLQEIIQTEKNLLAKERQILKNEKINLSLKSRVYEPLLIPIEIEESTSFQDKSDTFQPTKKQNCKENTTNKYIDPNESIISLKTDNCFINCAFSKSSLSLLTAGILGAFSGFVPKSLLKRLKIIPKAIALGRDGSNYASIFSSLEAAFPILRIPIRPLWSINLRFKNIKKLKRPMFKFSKTTTLFAFIGRWVPWIGWALLPADIAYISICTNRCMNDHKNNIS
ncbi:hypothetical protein [Commensalibacter oyaizuii]|uniref:Uncharacterized protein n=1 Tax=Commensalibacter oyaizuii TaxID=3043873 RepID=A0ABT6Q5P6_9PROT|nr:hypothetical protein [Commensalibacter sp. TBRC 16381]MDI2091886.1 hypothetical protein [Commensalibacter sp. TBRC 16381]